MTILATVGGSQSIGPTSGGKVYAYNNITTSPVIVVQPNSARRALVFHNPGSVPIFVAPVNAQGINSAPATPKNVTLTPSLSALGGCWYVPNLGGNLTLSGECSGAYQAFAASGTTNPLTVSESNV